MELNPARPSEALIINAYNRLLNSGMSLAKLRDSALGDRLLASQNNLALAGRSIVWKLFLMSEEPLNPSSSPIRSSSLLHSLRSARQDYVKRLREHMRAPDGSYEEGFVLPGSPSSLSRLPSRTETTNLETNNPLSLHKGNPWKAWFAAVDLRKTILQDVERTFPEITFFREPETQAQLTNILFLYSVMNPHIGYRQGMHEVLAPLFYAVDYDSLLPNGDLSEADVREACSRTWVAGDAWALFESVMRGLSRWYEWKEPPPNIMLNATPALATHVDLSIPGSPSQLEIKPYTAPIVETCNRVQSVYLRTTDPLLYRHLQAAGIEPQIYGIRWLRLLFTREFSMVDSMKLWDGLFACDPTLDLAQWVCVAMLIRIRNELLPADYSGQLTVLLRYPSPESVSPFEDAPHHTSLLLRQAIALQMSPSPSTGTSVIMENRNLLNIPIEVPAPRPAPQQRRSHNRTLSPSHGRLTPPLQGQSRQTTTPQMSLPEIIARGLIEKGESFGINKTLLSAVSELRRNIPDLAASLVKSPDTSESTFALTDERLNPSEERPPWEPRTRFEMEKDISTLRSTNKRLGETLEWAVDILKQDEAEAAEPQRVKKQKQEALESLSYVRDILLGHVKEIEEGRLVSEESWRRRRRPSVKRTSQVVVPPAMVGPEAQASRNGTPGAMMSPRTGGTSRIAGMPVSSGSRSGWGVGGVVPRGPAGGGDKAGAQTPQIEDPLGVGR